MEDILTNLSTYGYIILAVYSFGGGSLAIIGAAILSSMGKMDIELSLLIAITANFSGDLFFFLYIGFLKKYFKDPINKIIKKHSRKVAYTRLLIYKKGWLGMFIQKYVYIVKTIYPIMLGLLRYNNVKFIVLNGLASIFWGLSLGIPSYFFAETVQKFFS